MATLTVRGQGVVDVEPGLIEVVLTIRATAATAEEAWADASARGATLIEVFDALGVPPMNRRTDFLALHEDNRYSDAAQPPVRAYTAWSRTQVRIADVDAVRLLIAKAVERAGAGIEGVQGHVDVDHPARLEACHRAAAAAGSRAEAYAEALGLSLGRVVAAVEPGTTPVMRGRTFAPLSAPAYPVEAGNAQVFVALDVTYELGDDG